MSAALLQLGELDAIDLDALNDRAALQTRVDRKYVVRAHQLEAVLDRVAGCTRVLEIDGRRLFGYRSVYFDTPELDSYLGAARRRPDRFKVRTRTYLDTAADPAGCWVEVKLRTRDGKTAKHRLAHPADRADELVPDSLAFVASFPRLTDIAHRLDPVIVTAYRRTTLTTGTARATIDLDVTASTLDGRVASLRDVVVVETKSERAPGPVDRALWDLGIRPTTISKFAMGCAALHPALPSNKWARLLRDHVRVVPDR